MTQIPNSQTRPVARSPSRPVAPSPFRPLAISSPRLYFIYFVFQKKSLTWESIYTEPGSEQDSENEIFNFLTKKASF